MQRKMTQGTLTLKTDDGYVIEAPVEGFSVDVQDDYSEVHNEYDLYPSSIYRDSQTVTFTAILKYGESYTVRDVAVEIEKTFTVKGNLTDQSDYRARSALGVPATATTRYLKKNDVTKFTWKERVVIDA